MPEHKVADLQELLRVNVSKLTQWETKRYAELLLGSDDARAQQRIRELAPEIASTAVYGGEFWRDIDAALDLPPLDRVLRCLDVTGSDQALEGIRLEPQEVSRVVERLLVAESAFDREVHAPKQRLSLSVVWALRFADLATIQAVFARAEPTSWIERVQRSRLAKERGLFPSPNDASLDISEPQWARGCWKSHPARYRDGLTGAWSRAVLLGATFWQDGRLGDDDGWAEPLPSQWLVSVDIDGMKQRGDYYGHLAGDLAIMMVADVMQRICGDRVVRIGGDEFYALVDENGPAVAERMRALVESTPIAPRGHIEEPLSCTVTLGVADSGTLRDAARRAESAVRRGKGMARNVVVRA